MSHPLEFADETVAPLVTLDELSVDPVVADRISRNPGMLDRGRRKLQILHRYTAKEDFPAMSSIITDETELSEADRNRMKLSRLAALSAGESTLHGTQIELISIIERMDAELKKYWAEGDRVKSLRVAIQAIKLLGHTKVPQCYPSVFVLAATVLDTFGDLVSDRIQESAAQQSPLVAQLVAEGKDLHPSIIPPQAVEMCNNWFLKILSIRELLPRVYVELSLMRSYKYVAMKFHIESMRAVVERLAMQVRGVADPLVAAYACMYVCFRAKEVLSREDPYWGDAMVLCCEDTLHLVANLPPVVYETKGLKRSQYVSLFTPALQWLIDTVAKHSRPDVAEQFFDRTLRMMEANPNLCYSSIAAILTSAFRTDLVVDRIHRFTTMVVNAELTMTFDATPRLQIIANLCHALGETPAPLPYKKSDKMALINHLWEIVNADRANLEYFLVACRGLLRLLAVHTTNSQVAVLLEAVNQRVSEAIDEGVTTARSASPMPEGAGGSPTKAAGSSNVDLTTLCHDFLLSLVHYVPGGAIYSMWPQVIPLLHAVRPTERDEVVRQLLKSTPATSRFSATVIDLCRQLHDRLSDDSPAQVYEATSRAICAAIRQCFSADDVEAQLRFLCDCRHGLSQLDMVKVTVVEEAIRLVRAIVPTSTSKKVRSTAKGCFAFCHVTVPGITNTTRRISVCADAAAVAFHYGFVNQGEALLSFALSGLNDLVALERLPDGTTRNNDRAITRLATTLLNIGAAVPPHAKHGPLYTIISVCEFANEFMWATGSEGAWTIASAALRLLAALSAGRLTLAFDKCPNTAMLRQDPDFDGAAATVILTATNTLQREMTTSGRAVCAAAAAAAALYKSDGRVGRLLQKTLRVLVSGQCPGEGTEVEIIRLKVIVLGECRRLLGDEFDRLIEGDDLPVPQLSERAEEEGEEQEHAKVAEAA
jgi:hypothetical protein